MKLIRKKNNTLVRIMSLEKKEAIIKSGALSREWLLP